MGRLRSDEFVTSEPYGHRPEGWVQRIRAYPKALRTHNIRLLGPKTILYRAFGLF